MFSLKLALLFDFILNLNPLKKKKVFSEQAVNKPDNLIIIWPNKNKSYFNTHKQIPKNQIESLPYKNKTKL